MRVPTILVEPIARERCVCLRFGFGVLGFVYLLGRVGYVGVGVCVCMPVYGVTCIGSTTTIKALTPSKT